MSLQPLQLDDLTWTTMVDAIRSRIIADSNGQWTMHGPLDPGVSLLELFAYQFEQRLYWLDQVSEPLVRSLLSLLDDAPQTTTSAKTLLAFQSLDDKKPRRVRAGTVFYPRDHELALPFTTLERVTVLPIARVNGHPKLQLMVGDADRTSDLRAGRAPGVLPSDGGFAEFQINLWLERPLDSKELGRDFSLLLELSNVSGIDPEWAFNVDEMEWPDRVTRFGYTRPALEPRDLIPKKCYLVAADASYDARPSADPENWINDFVSSSWNEHRLHVDPPAKLTWRYSAAAGRKAFAEDALLDTTGSLRRSGRVRILIPDDWQPIATDANGLVAYAIYVTCEACTYSAPVRLRRIVPNVALAKQLESVELEWDKLKPQLDNWLRLPRQTIVLDEEKPEPLEKSVRLRLREADGWHEWRPTDHFYHHGPEDRVFVVDRLRKRLLFGNGLTGRIPTLDNSRAKYGKLCYHAGGGHRGNAGELIWKSQDTLLQTRNPVPAIGGADAKSIAEAKAGTAQNISRRDRAVTADDFEWLAVTTPGIAVARAHAAVGYHPDFPCYPVPGAITVFVVPRVPREPSDLESFEAVLAPITDPGALCAIARRLDARRLITSEVYVRSAEFRTVRIYLELRGIVSNEKALRADLRMLLTKYLDPLLGGDRGEGWPFGGPVRSSSFIKVIQSHLEKGIVAKRVAIALDDDETFEDCHDVLIKPHELVYLKQLSINIESMPTTSGGLR